MKIIMKMSRMIARSNPGFTFGLVLMTMLSVALAFIGANFPKSASLSTDAYIEESNAPDVLFITEFVDENVINQIKEIDGVGEVYPGVMGAATAKIKDDKTFLMNLYAREKGKGVNLFSNQHVDAKKDEIPVSITRQFAETNDVKPGDKLKLVTILGEVEVVVTDTVSSAETLDCKYDKLSIYEDYQFGCVYIERADYDKIFGMDGKSNQWQIYYSSSFDDKKEQEIYDEIKKLFADKYISGSLVKNSDSIKSLKNDIGSMGVICSVVPGIIWVISMGFCFIFMRQMVDNQRKNIGLLSALGYGKNEIISMFVAFAVIISLGAIVVGIPLGYVLLRLCLRVLITSSGMTTLVIAFRPVLTFVLMVVVLLLSVTAAILGSRKIATVDPLEAYTEKKDEYFEPPQTIARLKIDKFIKISLSAIARNFKKILIGAMCICASVVLMCLGLSSYSAVGYPIDYLFGDRYSYDLLVRNINDFDVNTFSQIEGVEKIEPVNMFSARLKFEDYSADIIVNTVAPDCEMSVVYNAKGEKICPTDGIIIDAMTAKYHNIKVGDKVMLDNEELTVEAISRELLYNVMYISPKTAKKLGYSNNNSVAIRLASDDIERVKNDIFEMYPNAYCIEMSLQIKKALSSYAAIKSVMIVCAVLAFLIGIFVVFNMSVIDFNEKRGRYATLRSLGTQMKKMSIISAVENLVRVMIGLVFSLPISFFAIKVVEIAISNESKQYVCMNFMQCFAISVLFAMFYVLIGTMISLRHIKKFDFAKYLGND